MANVYQAFYNNATTEVVAETSYAAQQKAAAHFKVKPKNAYKVGVVLAEKDGQPVKHLPLD